MLCLQTMEETFNICIVADDPLARAGLAALLATIPRLSIAMQGNEEMFNTLAADSGEVDVDIIIWDCGWDSDDHDPEESIGLGIPVIALIQDQDQASTAWRLGSRGLLHREDNLDQLPAAIEAVFAGLTVIAPGFRYLGHQPQTPPDDQAIVELTPRENQVLSLLAEGLTNKAIGYRLSISDHTVKFHVNAIMSKLDAQSRTAAVIRATRLGLLSI